VHVQYAASKWLMAFDRQTWPCPSLPQPVETIYQMLQPSGAGALFSKTAILVVVLVEAPSQTCRVVAQPCFDVA
jgi:hypothetical protein